LRFQGKSRLGFYPLPLSEAQQIRRFLEFPDSAPSSAIDPCVGDGKIVAKTEEEDEKGVITVREKERFSNELTVVYSTGQVAILK
jgi:hypothetical protein